MVYQWKLPGLYDIPAQTAGEELERIYKERGNMTPDVIVEESRPEYAPLHSAFEWDDTIAAEEWRKQQARHLTCCIVTMQESKKSDPITVRAFVHVENKYLPTSVVVSKKGLRNEYLSRALRDMEAFKRRFSTFESLSPVLNAIDETIPSVLKEIESEQKNN